ncbi:MAG: tetratricopeptide repeat protein [Pyrinomonadaceae bacterium]
MKPILVLIGCLSLALTGCGGAPSNANNAVAVPETVNTAPAVSQFASQFASITDANEALVEGKRLLDENQTETAIDALKRAVEIDPDLAEGHFQLGVAYALLEMQNEQSGKVTEPVSNSNSKETVKKSKSDKAFEDAVKAYKKWIAKNPKDDNAYYYLGRTYAKLMRDEDAEEAFQEAVKLKPEDSEYQTELGAILIKLAQYHEAIKPLKKAIELDDSNGRAFDLLEDAEAGKKRVDYVSKDKNANTTVPGKGSSPSSNSASNSNTAMPSNSSSPKTPEASPRSKKPEPEPKSKKGDPKEDRPRMVPEKPKPRG